MSFKSWIASLGSDVESWFEGAVESEATALAPIAEAAVSNLAVDEAQALATGNSANTGHILAAVMKTTAQQAEIAGITAAAPAILAAVGAASSKAPALVASKAAGS